MRKGDVYDNFGYRISANSFHGNNFFLRLKYVDIFNGFCDNFTFM